MAVVMGLVAVSAPAEAKKCSADAVQVQAVCVDKPAEPGRSVKIGDHEHPATSQHSRRFLHRTFPDGGG